MMIFIDNVLKREEINRILAMMAEGEFIDGRLSAAGMAGNVKRNLELRRPPGKPSEIERIVLQALMNNQEFTSFAMPRHLARPIFSRYEPGMEYGLHVDNPVMGQTSPLRSDLSLTIFLSDPASYDGGELTIQTSFGEQSVKLPPGAAVVYPSTTLHRVTPVTRGARMVALNWVQSLIQDEGYREVIQDLATVIQSLPDTGTAPDGKDYLDIKNNLFRAYANLMRRLVDV